MKKLTSILLSVCMLTTLFTLTGCGDENGEKWEYDENEGISVSHLNCRDIVSSRARKNIIKKLEEKYKDVNPTVTEESIEGLLKEVITLEKDDDYYFAESVRAEELDSIFEVNGHTAEAYVDVSLEEDFMEYEIYAEYDVDTYCFAEVDFATPEYLEKKEAEEQKRKEEEAEQKRKEEEQRLKEEEEQRQKEEEEQKLIEEKIGEYKYKSIVDEDSYCSNYTINSLEKAFKNATLTVTEDCIQILDYEFPIELNPYEDSLAEGFMMSEIHSVFTSNSRCYEDCIVKTDGTVCIEINYSPGGINHLITLIFVKQ